MLFVIEGIADAPDIKLLCGIGRTRGVRTTSLQEARIYVGQHIIITGLHWALLIG